MIRLTLLVFAFVFAPALWPAPAHADTPPECGAYLDNLAKDLETNTTMVDDLARPSHPTPDHVAQSAARYARDVDHLKQCPSTKKPYVDALLTTWSAWLEYATSHVNPIDAALDAARRLERCSTTYNGTDDGATCATWQKQVAKWQDEWGSP